MAWSYPRSAPIQELFWGPPRVAILEQEMLPVFLPLRKRRGFRELCAAMGGWQRPTNTLLISQGVLWLGLGLKFPSPPCLCWCRGFPPRVLPSFPTPDDVWAVPGSGCLLCPSLYSQYKPGLRSFPPAKALVVAAQRPGPSGSAYPTYGAAVLSCLTLSSSKSPPSSTPSVHSKVPGTCQDGVESGDKDAPPTHP